MNTQEKKSGFGKQGSKFGRDEDLKHLQKCMAPSAPFPASFSWLGECKIQDTGFPDICKTAKRRKRQENRHGPHIYTEQGKILHNKDG